MSIQRKLLILLLTITLVPLLAVVLSYQISVKYMTDNVSKDILSTLDENARHNMQRMLGEYDRALRSNVRMLETLLQLQINEVERALAGRSMSLISASDLTIGKLSKLKSVPQNIHDYMRVDSEGREEIIPVNFQAQDYVLSQGVKFSQISDDLGRLAALTEVYYKQFQRNPDMIYWLHTSLENGLHTSYPSGASFPADYDSRKRPWYIRTIAQKRLSWSDPYIDALSGQPMITLSAPVYRPNGELAGVTSLDILLTTVFRWMDLNPNWSQNAESMLIYKDDQNNQIKIFASMNYQKGYDSWEEPLQFETLQSTDTSAFRKLFADLSAGKSGIIKMPFKGVESLWIYQGMQA
ncbi:MAG: PDC sensor domain-containing protein, partial [bacterium]